MFDAFYGDVALFFQIFLDCSFPMNFLLKFYPSLMRWKGIRIVLIDHGKFRTVILHFPQPPPGKAYMFEKKPKLYFASWWWHLTLCPRKEWRSPALEFYDWSKVGVKQDAIPARLQQAHIIMGFLYIPLCEGTCSEQWYSAARSWIMLESKPCV